MNRRIPFDFLLIILATLACVGCQGPQETGVAVVDSASMTPQVPTFRVDPNWPQVPAQWKLGDVSSIAIDADDNAWLLHRPRVLTGDDAAMAAPPVVGFDPEGVFLKAWGGAAASGGGHKS